MKLLEIMLTLYEKCRSKNVNLFVLSRKTLQSPRSLLLLEVENNKSIIVVNFFIFMRVVVSDNLAVTGIFNRSFGRTTSTSLLPSDVNDGSDQYSNYLKQKIVHWFKSVYLFYLGVYRRFD